MSETEASRGDRDLFELYQLFLTFRAVTTQPERARLAGEIVVHPASRWRMRVACADVLRKSAGRRDLREDAVQEASCLVIRRLDSAALQFHDDGPSHFGGWLYTVWRNAFRHVWRSLRAQERRAVATVMPDRLARIAGMDDRDDLAVDRAERVFTIINEIEERGIYEVMLDWASGLSGVQSARLRNLSPSAVSKRRARGMELIARRLRQCR